MKKIVCLAVLLLALVSCSEKPVDLNVMTFNIRMDNKGDSLNSWPYRKDVAAEVVKAHDVDLLGAQEVLFHQLTDLKARLPEYQSIGVGREDGKEKGEYSAIFYKKDRFTEVKSGTFWLSETPEVAGSKGWDGACERVATWAILQEKDSKKQIFYINTHLDHVGKVARQEGVTLLLNRAKDLGKGLPIIITGDFNATPESDVIKHVTESGEFLDSRVIAQNVSGNTGTFHGFGRIPVERRQRIDFIFVTKQMSVTSLEVLPDQLNDINVSDHAPVAAHIILN
ncbi:MAG: endonuclease/exonuclease/phosphatase family protein [Tannerella sp.]|jgi:endonuclease/exonuclease/phosphatase family metal-dependent hydrolase|nr:endonuclease/exonuclease/phosphatase family protein [Tannerella sp.]